MHLPHSVLRVIIDSSRMDQEQELDDEVQTQVIAVADLSFEIRRILEQQTLDQIPLLESQIELQHHEFEVNDYFNPPSPSP